MSPLQCWISGIQEALEAFTSKEILCALGIMFVMWVTLGRGLGGGGPWCWGLVAVEYWQWQGLLTFLLILLVAMVLVFSM